MGSNESKQNILPPYKFQEYGLSADEGKALEKYFNQAAGKDHKLDHKEFQEVYKHLNPEANTVHAKQIADKAFIAADSSHDGHLTFDEFLAFYVMHKSPPQNVGQNMKNFLNHSNHNRGYITPGQAQYYSKFVSKYHGGLKGLVETNQDFMSKFSNQKIPITTYVDQMLICYYD